MSRTICLAADVNPEYHPDVAENFGKWDWAAFILEHYTSKAPGTREGRCWLPMHVHATLGCLTHSTGSAFLSGRTDGGGVV